MRLRILMLLCPLIAFGQEDLKVDWQFQSKPIFQEAFAKYEQAVSFKPSIFNFNVANLKPKIGILLANVKHDSLNSITEIRLWACFDESWKDYKFDHFAFFGNWLILINRGTQQYPTNEEWQRIVQDRVYERKKEERRKIISGKSNPRNELIFEEVHDKFIYINDTNHATELRIGPYNMRLIQIYEKTGKVVII